LGELVALSGTFEFGSLPLFLPVAEAGVLICKALIFGVVPRDVSSFPSALQSKMGLFGICEPGLTDWSVSRCSFIILRKFFCFDGI
uniref:Secreted protein n=1 Tax=Globodera pallida TaxID=36090 RepID=A0A183CPR1_GLOPA